MLTFKNKDCVSAQVQLAKAVQISTLQLYREPFLDGKTLMGGTGTKASQEIRIMKKTFQKKIPF